MKLTEKILALIFVILIFAKLNHYPFSEFALLSIGLVFAVFYIIFGISLFKTRLKNTDNEQYQIDKTYIFPSTIIAGFNFSIIIVGIIFKLLSWPGGILLLVVGIALLVIGIVVMLAKKASTPRRIYDGIILRIILFLIMGVYIYILTPFEVQYYELRHQKELKTLFEESQKDPSNEEKRERFEDAHTDYVLGDL